MEIKKKKVDEDWKNQVEQEKVTTHGSDDQGAEAPPPGIPNIVSVFATQALLHLGELANPLTGQKNVDLIAAKYNIDTLEVLKVKTEGNLSEEEAKYLEHVLYELKMGYVRRAGTLSST
jgi:hypothetical protein